MRCKTNSITHISMIVDHRYAIGTSIIIIILILSLHNPSPPPPLWSNGSHSICWCSNSANKTTTKSVFSCSIVAVSYPTVSRLRHLSVNSCWWSSQARSANQRPATATSPRIHLVKSLHNKTCNITSTKTTLNKVVTATSPSGFALH